MIGSNIKHIRVVIPGEPVAQGRGRAVRIGDSVRVIDPAKSRSWKGVARVFMVQARARAMVFEPLDGPLSVTIVATWTLPKSAPKRNPPAWKVTKPDADNVAKAVLDAGCGVLFLDDKSVVRLVVEKRYGPEPSVSVTVESIDAALAAKEAK